MFIDNSLVNNSYTYCTLIPGDIVTWTSIPSLGHQTFCSDWGGGSLPTWTLFGLREKFDNWRWGEGAPTVIPPPLSAFTLCCFCVLYLHSVVVLYMCCVWNLISVTYTWALCSRNTSVAVMSCIVWAYTEHTWLLFICTVLLLYPQKYMLIKS